MIHYAIMDFDSETRDEIPLTAKTDNDARKEAKQTAAESSIERYGIVFYRESDGCHGWIEA